MGLCKGVTRKGGQCRNNALPGTDYCHISSHQPPVKQRFYRRVWSAIRNNKKIKTAGAILTILSTCYSFSGDTIQHYEFFTQNDLERQRKESDPKVEINLIPKPGELLIKIRAEKYVSALALDIPVLGKLVNVHDYNSIADAATQSIKVVGEDSDISINNVELLIENIKAQNEISYKIIYKKLPIPLHKIHQSAFDRYRVSYTWQFTGRIFSKEEWRSIQTGQRVDKPQVEIKGLFYENRDFSPEEIKKHYEDGLKKRKIE